MTDEELGKNETTTEVHDESRRRQLAYNLMRSSLAELLTYCDAPVFDHASLDYVVVHVDREAIAAAHATLDVVDMWDARPVDAAQAAVAAKDGGEQ